MARFIQETMALTRREFLHLSRQPFSILFSLVQPVFWLVLFGNMFRQVVHRPEFGSADYLSFITASVISMTVVGNSLVAGIPLLMDRELGFLDKLLVAPISRLSILLSRFIVINAVSSVQVTAILLLAIAMGVAMAGGWVGVLEIYLVAALLGLGITLISLSLAFVLRHHAEFFAIVGFLNLPLVFVSSALVPLGLMPGWMSWLARINPMTYAIDGIRSLILPGWYGTSMTRVVLALAVFNALCLYVSTRTFRRNLA